MLPCAPRTARGLRRDPVCDGGARTARQPTAARGRGQQHCAGSGRASLDHPNGSSWRGHRTVRCITAPSRAPVVLSRTHTEAGLKSVKPRAAVSADRATQIRAHACKERRSRRTAARVRRLEPISSGGTVTLGGSSPEKLGRTASLGPLLPDLVEGVADPWAGSDVAWGARIRLDLAAQPGNVDPQQVGFVLVLRAPDFGQ